MIHVTSPNVESPGVMSRMMVVAKQGLLEMVGQVVCEPKLVWLSPLDRLT